MEHMVGRTVVQTRLSLEELHKAVQREVGTWRVGKGRGGGTMAQLYLTRA